MNSFKSLLIVDLSLYCILNANEVKLTLRCRFCQELRYLIDEFCKNMFIMQDIKGKNTRKGIDEKLISVGTKPSKNNLQSVKNRYESY